MTRPSATDRLVDALKALPASLQRDRLVARAEARTYHVFETTLPDPKRTLVTDLIGAMLPGCAALVVRVKAGEFDESHEEAEAWFGALGADRRIKLMAAFGSHKAEGSIADALGRLQEEE